MKKSDNPVNFVALGATVSEGLKEELKREAKESGMLFSSYIESILVLRPEPKKLPKYTAV